MPKCPECGSENVRRVGPDVPNSGYECLDCIYRGQFSWFWPESTAELVTVEAMK